MIRKPMLMCLSFIVGSCIAGTTLAHSGDDNRAGNWSEGNGMGPGSGMMMHHYSDEQSDRFERSYRDMEQLMERIHQTEGYEEHERLMEEHMEQMQSYMHMMDDGWQLGPPDDRPRTDDSDEWRHNMEQRLFLMQQMLNQMIEREAARFENNDDRN